jgi:Lar family restriction alleviation protein
MKDQQMKETELKPCPFCGGEAEIHRAKSYLDDVVQIHCTQCNVHTPKRLINHLAYRGGEQIYILEAMAIEQATYDWNRRADNERN